MFLINRIYKPYRYNMKYALKVQKIYSNITLQLQMRKIYGCNRVKILHKEMRQCVSIGMITIEEYKHWILSQKLV